MLLRPDSSSALPSPSRGRAVASSILTHHNHLGSADTTIKSIGLVLIITTLQPIKETPPISHQHTTRIAVLCIQGATSSLQMCLFVLSSLRLNKERRLYSICTKPMVSPQNYGSSFIMHVYRYIENVVLTLQIYRPI